MKIVGEDKPAVRPVVRKVFTVVSLAWSCITLAAWITAFLVWPEGHHVEITLLLNVISFVFTFGSLGSLPLALLAFPVVIRKRMKAVVLIAGAIPPVIFGIVFVYAASQCC